MRKIEFRGKWLRNDDWVYGNYEYYHKPEKYIISDFYSQETFGIDKNTLGQYTGLKDKNGTKIFEGDILEFEFDDIGKQVAIVEFIEKYACFRLKPVANFGFASMSDGKLIGNIHDNPELLEVDNVKN